MTETVSIHADYLRLVLSVVSAAQALIRDLDEGAEVLADLAPGATLARAAVLLSDGIRSQGNLLALRSEVGALAAWSSDEIGADR